MQFLPASEFQPFHFLQIIHFSPHFYIDKDINLSFHDTLIISII